MNAPRIKGQAVLIGYDPEGRCIYSEILDLSDYYDEKHVWDEGEAVKELRIEKVKGYLFDSAGTLTQEFESVFDLTTGIFRTGYVYYADGTRKDFPAV